MSFLRPGRRQSYSLPRILALLILIASVLGATAAVVHAQTSAPGTDAGRVRSDLKEILSQPEFRPEAPDSPMAQLGRSIRDSMDRAWRWLKSRWSALQKAIERLFSGFGNAGGPVASVISKVVMVVLIGLGIWLVAWLLRGFLINRRTNQARTRTTYDEAEEDDGIAREPEAWLQQAEVYADGEDYRRAFRAVFVAILLLLDQAGLVEYDRARTNGDYLRLLRRLNARQVYEILDPLVNEFDRRWYGRAETGYEDYARIQKTMARIRELLRDTAVPAGNTATAATGKV